MKKVCLLQHEFYKDCLKEEQAHAAAAAAGESTNSNSRGNSVSIISGGSSSGTDHMVSRMQYAILVFDFMIHNDIMIYLFLGWTLVYIC